MKACFSTLLAVLCILLGTRSPAQTQRALLIGINTYQPAGTQAEHPPGCTYGRCELGYFENLEGAVNDARSMADVLISPKFGFPAKNVVLLTNPAPPDPVAGVVLLPADQTTRDGILAAMQKYLVDLPQRGDTVVFYDASHGSLRVNSKGAKLTVAVGGQLVPADSTLVPSDAYKGGYDVRDREMTRIFNAALDKGVRLTVILDSCHSGAISRGLGPKFRQRALAFDPRDIGEGPDLVSGQPRPFPTERKDNPALIFSAAQQDQSANEMPDPSVEPHGAFTAALLDALKALPADTPADLVYQRVRGVLEGGNVPDQEPDLDASAARRQQTLFGGKAADSGKLRTAALKSNNDGSILLDIGRASGIGIGSEFTATDPDSKGQRTELRITGLDGIARSLAVVVSPLGAKANSGVTSGEFFELSKWKPAESPPLLVWQWPANLSGEQVMTAAAQIRSSGAVSVADPAEEPWTHMLSWDGANWMLLQAGAASPVSLGAPLDAGVLRRHLPPGAKLWANLPPSRELAAKLVPGDPSSAVQPAADFAEAQYALTGVLTTHGPAYAWFHAGELRAGPPAAGPAGHSLDHSLGHSLDHSPGCSSNSRYPVRSDWVAMNNASELDKSSAALNKFAALLAKVHGWLDLADNPVDATKTNYYSLALVPDGGQAPLSGNEPAHQGDVLRMALVSSVPVTDKRWVYVLDIDCNGKGTVLYPGTYTENRFPNDADSGNLFYLPGVANLRIGPPYGVDSLILLSTSEPLPFPDALNFEGVATEGTRGAQSPLERLLNQASSGTRGDPGVVPTNWGIGLTTLRSIPNDAVK